MKSLKNTAKSLNSFCKIGTGFCGSIAILLPIVIAIIAIIGGPTALFENVVSTLTIDPVEFEISNEYVSNLSINKAIFFTTFALAELSLILIAFFCKFVQKIFCPLIEEKPFDGSVSKNITKLSNFVIIGGATYSILSMLGQYFILKWFDIENLFINENIIGLRIDNDFDITFVFIALLLRMLAIIFKYGEELQKESDETL